MGRVAGGPSTVKGTHPPPYPYPYPRIPRQIFHKHAFSTSTTPREAYLGMLSKRDYYGAALFVAKQRFEKAFPKRLYIAIGRRGVLLVRMPEQADDEEGMETLQSYPLADTPPYPLW